MVTVSFKVVGKVVASAETLSMYFILCLRLNRINIIY